MAKVTAVNVDTIRALSGDIARATAQAYGVALAQADTVDNSKGIRGIWTTMVTPGATGEIDNSSEVEINVLDRPTVGGVVYLSDTVKGKATAIQPAISVPIGTVVAFRSSDGIYKATVNIAEKGTEESLTEALESMNVGKPSTGSFICPALSAVADGTYLTIGDGTHTVKLEPRACAISTVVLKELADIENNMTLVVDDGTNEPTTFEAQVTPIAVAPTGQIACVEAAKLRNNETVTLNDGVNTPTVLTFNVKAAAAATGTIVSVAKANYIQGETITLDDGTNPATVIEIDVAGTGVDPGNVAADISGADTAAQCATVLAGVVNGVAATLGITAGVPTDEVVHLTADSNSYLSNITITHTVADPGFSVTGMSGGVSAFSAGVGQIETVLTAATTENDVAEVLKSTINNVAAALAITAGDTTGQLVPLVNDVWSDEGNIAITHTVLDPGFSVTGMSAGHDGYIKSDPAYVTVDLVGVTTDQEKTQAFADAIDGVVEGLVVTTSNVLENTFTLTEDSTGTATLGVSGTALDTVDVVSAGLGGVPVVGATEVDLTGILTGALAAPVYKSTINGIGAGLTVTATNSGAAVNLVNDSVGPNNVAITETGGTAFTIVGMEGGYNSIVSDMPALSEWAANGIHIADVENLVTDLAGKQPMAAPLTAISAGTNVAPVAATTTLLESGAKAIVQVTLVAFADWNAKTVEVPGVAAKTIGVDIDISTATDTATGAAIVGPYMAAAAGSLVDYVGVVGQVMTFRGKAYGRSLNGQLVSGTLLTAAGVMEDGVDAYDGATKRSKVIYNDSFAGKTSLVFSGLSASKRYDILLTCAPDGAAGVISLRPDSADASDCFIMVDASPVAGGSVNFLYIGYAGVKKTFRVTLHERIDGLSYFESWSAGALRTPGEVFGSSGATADDYTALEVAMTTAMSGTIKITETE